MIEGKGTLQRIVEHLAFAIIPFKWVTTDFDEFRIFMRGLGWTVHSLPPVYSRLGDQALETLNAIEALGSEPDLTQLRSIIDKVASFCSAIRSLRQEDVPDGVNSELFLSEIGETLFEYLLVQYLSSEFPSGYTVLKMLGLITNEVSIETGERPSYVRTRINYDKISALLAEPWKIPWVVYGWGSAEFDFSDLSAYLLDLFYTLGFVSSWELVSPDLQERFQQGDSRGEISYKEVRKSLDSMVKVELFDIQVDKEFKQLGFAILEFPGERSFLPGIIIRPLIPGNIEGEVTINKDWSIHVYGKNNLEEPFGIALRPDDLWIRFPFRDSNNSQSDFDPNTIDFGLKLRQISEIPWILVGQSGQTRFQLQNLNLGLDLKYLRHQFELCVYLAAQELALVLHPENLDGFLAKLVGSSEVSIAIPFSLEWSSSTGITFGGSPGFSLETLPHLNLGPLTIERFAIEIRSSFGDNRSTDLMLAIVIALSARLGPVTASAAGLGLKLSLVFPDRDGFDVNFGYQAPNGIGLSIAAKGVTGGGLLAFEPSKHLYSGFLGLNFRDIGLSAIGLILTESPNNPNTFSLLVSIGVKFTPPLQLSMGFRLMGVGGLIGVNRSLAVEPLRAGFKNRTLDAILFPDPASFIDNSPTILSNLEQFFPNSEAQYMVGPIVKLGWGSPPIINGEIGVLMVFPDPVTVFVLGRIVATFPKKDKPLIVINLDILGMVDFAQQQLSFQASLYDSKVLDYRLEGDSAFLLGWSNDPRFALAIGGFHPAFTPPSPATIFSDLKRVSLIISAGKNLNIKCLAYQALTSNSLHFGAKINLAVSAVGFSVKGHLGFDALFCFSPFLFEIQISGGVRLEYEGLSLFGVNLDLLLAGPTPWHARGKLKIKILFFTIPLSFDKRWGLSDFSKLPSVDPKPLLLEALNNPLAWGGSLPDSQGMVEQVAGNESQNSLLLWEGSIQDLNALVNKISPSAIDSVSVFLWENFEPPIRQILTDENSTPEQLLNALVQGLNRIIQGDSLYEEARFAGVNLREETRSLIERQASGKNLLRLNRLLLEDAYPEEISRNTLILLHPLSRLEIRQNVVPLGLQLEKMGNSPVSGHDRFELESLTIGNRNYTQSELEHLHEFFARGQYRELTGDQKLSLPSFEKMPAGAAMISESTLFDQAKTVRKPAGYKTIVVDEDDINQPALAEVDWNWAKVSVGAKAVSLAAARAGDRATYTPLTLQPAVSFQQERYYIARASNLTLAELTIELPWQNTGLPRMCADQLLKAHLELHPEQTDELIVIPAYELAA